VSRLARGALLVVAAIWWAPTIAVGLVLMGAFYLRTWRLLRRARHLRLAGRHAEAMAMLERAGVQVVEEQSGGR
jgi:hypothetical protein